MVEQVKPSYVLAADVEPLQRVFSIYKVIQVSECETIPPRTSNTKFIIKLADKSGTLNMFLKDETLIKLCQSNTYVEVLNAQARIYKGYIQLEMDKWGVIRPCEDQSLQELYANPVNTETDFSAVQYELVNDGQEKSNTSNSRSKHNNEKPKVSKSSIQNEQSLSNQSADVTISEQKAERGGRGRGRGRGKNANHQQIQKEQ